MTDYFECRKDYLKRLQVMRERERKHLSRVDFELFTSRFDLLINKVQHEIAEIEAEQLKRFESNVRAFHSCQVVFNFDPQIQAVVFETESHPVVRGFSNCRFVSVSCNGVLDSETTLGAFDGWPAQLPINELSSKSAWSKLMISSPIFDQSATSAFASHSVTFYQSALPAHPVNCQQVYSLPTL